MNEIKEKTRELIHAKTCSKELKEVATRWLEGLETDETFKKELKLDIMPIENLIAFASSEEGKNYFGDEVAENIVIHAKEIEANGGKYCDCEACKLVLEILNLFGKENR